MEEFLYDKWLSIEEVLKYLGINKDTMIKRIKNSDSNIQTYKIGKQCKIKLSKLDK